MPVMGPARSEARNATGGAASLGGTSCSALRHQSTETATLGRCRLGKSGVGAPSPAKNPQSCLSLPMTIRQTIAMRIETS